jgi:hypothetical protein
MTLPTHRLILRAAPAAATEDDANDFYNSQILEYGAKMLSNGKRAWFEIIYPPPAALIGTVDPIEWMASQEETFDAVEVTPAGEIITLPPYSELERVTQ